MFGRSCPSSSVTNDLPILQAVKCVFLYTVFIVQAYETSQYVVPCGGIFLGKWRRSFAGSSDGKINAQLACVLNIRYMADICNGQISENTPL
jgi:hypothetical protein